MYITAIMPRPRPPISLHPSEANELAYWAADAASPSRRVRARIILLAAADTKKSNQEIAAELKTTAHCVGRWRRAFLKNQLDGIRAIAGRGRKKSTARKDAIKKIKKMVSPWDVQEWTPSVLQRELGLEKSMVRRALNDSGSWLSSMRFTPKDYPALERRLIDIVGIRCAHGHEVLALRVDTEPCLPPSSNSLDFLFRPLKGEQRIKPVPSREFDCKAWINFSTYLVSRTKAGFQVYILDTYNSRKHPEIKAWLNEHPRVEWRYVRNHQRWLDIVRMAIGFLHRSRRAGSEATPDGLLGVIQKVIQVGNEGMSYEWKARYKGARRGEAYVGNNRIGG